MLHQKELVLNATDTENLLKAIDLIRTISKTIDLNALSASSGLASLLNSSSTVTKEKEELLHHVYQLAGKQCGSLLPQQPHLCNSTWLNQIPCIVSSCSFHSRKPDCREFDFLYDFY